MQLESLLSLLRVFKDLCIEFSAASFIGCILALADWKILLVQLTCGIFIFYVAFVLDSRITSSPE